MSQKIISGSEQLGKVIRNRRNELNLTIEEAAGRAGVGTKTWCRYEAGGSIRADKIKGIRKALNLINFPNQEIEEKNEEISNIDEYCDHEAWSPFLESAFGPGAAFCFATGSDILLDHLNDDLNELAVLPKGSHIGQLDISWLVNDLPDQFLMYYDYEFLFMMKCELMRMRKQARRGGSLTAHSVIHELLIYLCCEEGNALLELCPELGTFEDEDLHGWVWDLFDDMDLITCLYSYWYLTPDHSYHFSHWGDEQFYVGS